MSYMPIAIAFDDNYALPGWITVSSLLESAAPETSYHIFVLRADNISASVQDEISKLFASTRHRLDFIEISAERFKNVKTGWSGVSTYFRLILHEYITQYDQVIWTDVDVLIKQDLSAVTSFDISQSYWAGIGAEPNAPGYIFHGFYPENTNTHNFMPGFMLVNLKKMREDGMSKVFFRALDNYKEILPFYDLTILNLCCPNIIKLPVKYCVLERLYPRINRRCTDYRNVNFSYSDEEIVEAVRNPAIVHFAGYPVKIWKRPYWHIPKFYRSHMDRCPFYQRPSFAELLQSFPAYVITQIRREWKYAVKDLLKRFVPSYAVAVLKNILALKSFFSKPPPSKSTPSIFTYICNNNAWYSTKVLGGVMKPSVWNSEIFGFSPALELVLRMESDGVRQSLCKVRVFGAGFAAEEGNYTPIRDKISHPVQSKKKPVAYALRGKLSLERFEKLHGAKLHPECILADGALLAPSLLETLPDKVFRLGIAGSLPDKEQQILLAQQPGSTILDENLPHMEYLRHIAQCETLISDSLLPLVLADSLGIPNLWVGDFPLYTHRDYYSAYGIEAKPFPFKEISGGVPALIRQHYAVPRADVQSKIEDLQQNLSLLKKDIILERMP